MGSLENLKPFKKGQSGNPKGRPKGTSITSRLKKLCEQAEGQGYEAIAQAMFKAAMKGDFRFCKEIIDRIDGKIPDKVESDNETKIIIEYQKPEIKQIARDNAETE